MHADRGLFIELIRGKKVEPAVSAIKFANNAKIDPFHVFYEVDFLLALYFLYVDILYMINLLARKSKKLGFCLKTRGAKTYVLYRQNNKKDAGKAIR